MNEKSVAIATPALHRRVQGRTRAWATTIIAATFSGMLLGRSGWLDQLISPLTTAAVSNPRQLGASPHTSNDAGFDWESISPSRDLVYVPCLGKFQCARLLLPMDWTAPEERWLDHEVAIAMIKQPANVSILDPRYGGEVYMNPGGPGAQGVSFLTGPSNSQLVSAINGKDPNGKVFDLVSFDPRGIGLSTPRVSCFDDLVSRQIWHQLGTVYGSVDTGDWSFNQLWARAQSLEKLCDPGSPTSDKALALSTVTTPFVARDMLAMVERSGEARERSARKALAQSKRHDATAEVPEVLRHQPGKELLQYWGFSYGAFLGGTFASLYPDRVGRMIVDGCGDWDDNASGEFQGFLIDTDREWREFFNLCYSAGEEKCALYNAKGPDAMQQSIQDLIDGLERNPIAIWEEGMVFPEVFTKDILVHAIFSSLYRPYRSRTWIRFAETLAALVNGTITPAVKEMLPSRKLRLSTQECRTPQCITEGLNEGFWSEINFGVYCPDSPDFRNLTKSDMITWIDGLKKQSPLFGGLFASTSKMPCVGYPVRPKWRFDGPFGGKTKWPMLFIANTLDPMAPLEGTLLNVPKFEGARLLQQDSVGHCSTNAPSNCTASYVRRYLVSGELPDEGTLCSVDYSPFDDEK